MIPRQWLFSCHRRRASAEAHPSPSPGAPRGLPPTLPRTPPPIPTAPHPPLSAVFDSFRPEAASADSAVDARDASSSASMAGAWSAELVAPEAAHEMRCAGSAGQTAVPGRWQQKPISVIMNGRLPCMQITEAGVPCEQNVTPGAGPNYLLATSCFSVLNHVISA